MYEPEYKLSLQVRKLRLLHNIPIETSVTKWARTFLVMYAQSIHAYAAVSPEPSQLA